MQVKPIRDRILVKPIATDTTTPGGIFIPDNATDSPIKGTVISAGTGRIAEDGSIIPLEVSAGSVVMYLKGAGQTIKVDEEDHLILTEDQILAIVE
jgi:chaperonin GroES